VDSSSNHHRMEYRIPTFMKNYITREEIILTSPEFGSSTYLADMKKKAKAEKSVKKSKPKKEKLQVINLKITSADRKAILAMAKRYAKGNLSAWLRAAGLEYIPSKKHPVPLKIKK